MAVGADIPKVQMTDYAICVVTCIRPLAYTLNYILYILKRKAGCPGPHGHGPEQMSFQNFAAHVLKVIYLYICVKY